MNFKALKVFSVSWLNLDFVALSLLVKKREQYGKIRLKAFHEKNAWNTDAFSAESISLSALKASIFFNRDVFTIIMMKILKNGNSKFSMLLPLSDKGSKISVPESHESCEKIIKGQKFWDWSCSSSLSNEARLYFLIQKPWDTPKESQIEWDFKRIAVNSVGSGTFILSSKLCGYQQYW